MQNGAQIFHVDIGKDVISTQKNLHVEYVLRG